MTIDSTAWRKAKDCFFEIRFGFKWAPISIGDMEFRIPVALRRLKAAEVSLLQALKSYLKPGNTFVDVGADVGLISLYAAACSAPGGQVYAFEPLGENAALLRRGISLNGYERRILVVESAVSSDANRTHPTFFAGATDSGMDEQSSLRASGANSREVTVANTTLDTFFADKPKVDFIKIDTEVAEWDVIAGAHRLIARDRSVLCIEYHGGKCADFGYTPDELRPEVQRLGYSETIILGKAATGYNQTLALPQ